MRTAKCEAINEYTLNPFHFETEISFLSQEYSFNQEECWRITDYYCNIVKLLLFYTKFLFQLIVTVFQYLSCTTVVVSVLL